MSTSQTKPNLFIVGFQKCGSSSLFDLLCQHSEVIGTNPKETFALTDDRYPNFSAASNVSNSTFSWDQSFDVNQKNKKYLLEGSVCNFYQKRALEYISSLNNKKVIFILRDPVERFVSTFGYYGNKIKAGGPLTTLESYFDAVTNEDLNIENEGAKNAINHGHYSKYIKTWQDKLGEENVYVISFKKLRTNTQDEFSKLLEFLGLDPFGEWKLEHKNKTKTAKNKRMHYYLLKYFKNSGLGKTALGKFYGKLNSTTSKAQISEELKSKIKVIYSSEYQINGNLF